MTRVALCLTLDLLGIVIVRPSDTQCDGEKVGQTGRLRPRFFTLEKTSNEKKKTKEGWTPRTEVTPLAHVGIVQTACTSPESRPRPERPKQEVTHLRVRPANERPKVNDLDRDWNRRPHGCNPLPSGQKPRETKHPAVGWSVNRPRFEPRGPMKGDIPPACSKSPKPTKMRRKPDTTEETYALLGWHPPGRDWISLAIDVITLTYYVACSRPCVPTHSKTTQTCSQVHSGHPRHVWIWQ